MSNTEIHLNPTEIDLSSKKSFPCPRFGEKNVAAVTDPATNTVTPAQKYYSAPLIYKHPVENSKGVIEYIKQERWLVQGPTMRSRGGINFEQKGKRWSAYISVSLDPKQDGILDFTGKPVELSKWIDMPEKSTKNVIGR